MAPTICNSAALYIESMQDRLNALDSQSIDTLASWLFNIWRNDRLVVTLGNGGSAFTASHLVTDLVKTAAVDGRRRLRAISLADNMGLVTAVGNDLDYEEVFAYQLESFARRDDLAIAISASGNSPNVIKAARWANAHGVQVVALTGFDGGKLATMADLSIHVPSNNYGIIEDLHLAIGHMISQSLRCRILNDGDAS